MTQPPSCHRFFAPAALRGVTAPSATGAGLSFDRGDGRVTRLWLTKDDLCQLAAMLDHYGLRAETRDHSDMSSGIPSSEGSPQDGQNVAPDARSSMAEIGDA